jgi:hypothetical protein
MKVVNSIRTTLGSIATRCSLGYGARIWRTPCDARKLLGRRRSRHSGRVMIDDYPAPISLSVDKAEPRLEVNWFAVPNSDVQEVIGPTIDGCVAVDAHPLLSNDDFVFWRKRWQRPEVVSYGRRAVANRRRRRPPQHCLRVIQHHHAFGIVAIHGINPYLGRSRHVLLGPGRCR